MPDLLITSLANQRLKDLLALRRRRVREQAGRTLIEGHEELAVALAAGVRPRTVYYCPELFSPAGRAGVQDIGTQDALLDHLRAGGVELVRLSRPAFEKVAYREGPDGILAEAPIPARSLDDVAARWQSRPSQERSPQLVLVCQGVEKPGNLGAILRTADAAGVDAVIAADPVTDWGNPNVVRASKGTVFALDVVSADTATTIEWLRAQGFAIVVTTPDADVRHTDTDLSGRVAIFVGSEKHGVTQDVLDAADRRVAIPMAGRVNSLNVSVAAAVVLYEAVRQRGS